MLSFVSARPRRRRHSSLHSAGILQSQCVLPIPPSPGRAGWLPDNCVYSLSRTASRPVKKGLRVYGTLQIGAEVFCLLIPKSLRARAQKND